MKTTKAMCTPVGGGASEGARTGAAGGHQHAGADLAVSCRRRRLAGLRRHNSQSPATHVHRAIPTRLSQRQQDQSSQVISRSPDVTSCSKAPAAPEQA